MELKIDKKELAEERQRIRSWGQLVQARVDAVFAYAGERVLDAGCSGGAYVRLLRERGYTAYGIDLLPEGKWNAFFLAGDIVDLPFKDESFDTVIAFEVLEHLKEVDSAIKEFYRVCKKNIIVSVPNCSQPRIFQESGLTYHHWRDRTHVQFFTEDTLKRVLSENGFSVDHVQYINPIIPELLFFSSWRVPLKAAHFVSQIATKMPLRQTFHMTILAVASKSPSSKANEVAL